MMDQDPLKMTALARTRARFGALAVLAAVTLAACGSGSDAPEATGEPAAAAPAQQPGGDMIIVSGASGQLGGMVVDDLLELGVAPSRLILVSRTPDGLQRYAAMGASTRFGDFTQPESLAAAYAGGDRMLLISINSDVGGRRADLHKNAIDAAVAAGVRRIAYTSLVDLDNNNSALAADHKRTEQFLRDSGVAWTMLRNNLYMDGVVTEAINMLVDGRVESRTTGGIGYVTRADCAAAAAAVLATDGHDNRAYDITGPAVVFPQDIARALTEVTELPVRIVDPSGQAPASGPLSSPSFAVVSTAVQELTGRAPLSVHDLLLLHHDEIMAGTGA